MSKKNTNQKPKALSNVQVEKKVLSLYEEDKTPRMIAKELNEQAIIYKGKKLNRSIVQRIIIEAKEAQKKETIISENKAIEPKEITGPRIIRVDGKIEPLTEDIKKELIEDSVIEESPVAPTTKKTTRKRPRNSKELLRYLKGKR